MLVVSAIRYKTKEIVGRKADVVILDGHSNLSHRNNTKKKDFFKIIIL